MTSFKSQLDFQNEDCKYDSNTNDRSLIDLLLKLNVKMFCSFPHLETRVMFEQVSCWTFFQLINWLPLSGTMHLLNFKSCLWCTSICLDVVVEWKKNWTLTVGYEITNNLLELHMKAIFQDKISECLVVEFQSHSTFFPNAKIYFPHWLSNPEVICSD